MNEDLPMSRTKSLALKVGAPLGFLVFLLLLWQVAVDNEWMSSFILPPPMDAARSFYELLFEEDIWPDIWATAYVALFGFLLGAVLGIALAIAVGLSRFLNAMLYPFIVALQVMPRVAIAPILIAWLGFGQEPIFVVLVVFFPIFVNTLAGFQSVDAESREMFRSLGANRRQTFTKLLLPKSLPVMFAGFKTGITFALLAVIVAEFLSGDKGLGVLVSKFASQLNSDDAFAIIGILTIMGLVFYAGMQLLDRLIVFWEHDSRMSARTRHKNRRDPNRSSASGTEGATKKVATPAPSAEPAAKTSTRA
jgi:NitT/TauT family transport system permease protein